MEKLLEFLEFFISMEYPDDIDLIFNFSLIKPNNYDRITSTVKFVMVKNINSLKSIKKVIEA